MSVGRVGRPSTLLLLMLSVIALLAVAFIPIGTEASDQIEEVESSRFSPWPMYGGGPQHTGLSPFSIEENRGKVEKKVSGNHFSGTPVIGENGTIYISSSRGVYCLDPAGDTLWMFETESPIKGSPALSSDGTMYIATHGRYDNYLYSIDLHGSVNWMRPLGGYGCQIGPCVTEDGRIYIGTTQGYLMAFNEQGISLWGFSAGDAIISSPTVDDNGSVYFSCYDGYLYSLSSEGELRWRFPVGGGRSTPAIGHDGTIYFGSSNGTLYALDPNGSESWNYSTDGPIYYGVAIGPDNSISVQSGNKLQKVGSNGSLIWEVGGNFEPSFNQAPTVDRDGNIIIERGERTDQGNNFLIEAYAADGSLRWSIRFGEIGNTEPFPASITEDGKVLAVNEGGYLYMIGDDLSDQFYLQLVLELAILEVAAVIVVLIWYAGREGREA